MTTDLDSNAVSSEAIQLAELIRGARSVVALTGAGISVPSGIPDFRTPGTGLWTNVDPMEVAHIDVFRRDPARFWHFYRRSSTSSPTPPMPRWPAWSRPGCFRP
jgi:NAD-dependent SIR2 family protein deacetylase